MGSSLAYYARLALEARREPTRHRESKDGKKRTWGQEIVGGKKGGADSRSPEARRAQKATGETMSEQSVDKRR